MDIAKIIIELQAIAQIGLTYSKDAFDSERFNRIGELATEMATFSSSKNYDEVKEIFSSDTGYKTPKVEVRGAAFKQDKILLVKETSDGLWALPGGACDVNYSASENIIKEIFEESGFICKADKLISIRNKNRLGKSVLWPHVYKIMFLCSITGGERRLSYETSDIDFFSIDNLPPLSLGRVNHNDIELAFKHYKDAKVPTVFD